MSTREASLSFLSSIDLGHGSPIRTKLTNKRSQNDLRKSTGTVTPKRNKLSNSTHIKKKTPILEDVEKKNATDFLKGISLGESNITDGIVNESTATSSLRSSQGKENKLIPMVEVKKNSLNREEFREIINSQIDRPRYMFKLANGTFYTSSLIYQDNNKKTPIRSSDVEKPKQGVSYGYIFSAQPSSFYDPTYLDNSSTKPEKLKTVIKLPCYCVTIIPFFDEKEAKEEENEAFVDRHSWLETDLTLSKIRSAKRKLYAISLRQSINIACVAVAFVYLEKLILKNGVTKNNFKSYSSICLLLAVKFYGQRKLNYSSLLKEMEETFDITVKEILQNEFKAYKTLEFSLLTHTHEYMPHLLKIQRDYQ